MAIRIKRERHVTTTGRTTVTVSYALASLSPGRVTPQQLRQVVRYH